VAAERLMRIPWECRHSDRGPTAWDVLLTVDTEFYPDNPAEWSRLDADRFIARDVYGRTASGEYGLAYQIDRLNHYALKAVFFVGSLFPCAVGIEPLREIVAKILAGCHEVQLHLHPEWLAWMRDSVLPGRTGQTMREFSEEEQSVLVARGLDNLQRAGAADVCAFRAGDFAANFATLHALSRNGLKFDTSYNVCYLEKGCDLRFSEPLRQPRMVTGICEIPVSFFADFPGHHRPAQLCATSHLELRRALLEARKAGWPTFVIVSHSFELIRRRPLAKPTVSDSVVIRRFEKLCQFLANNRDQFRTVGFSDLDPATVARGGCNRGISSLVLLTVLRNAEQFARRLQR
jgi:hypothetical protein